MSETTGEKKHRKSKVASNSMEMNINFAKKYEIFPFYLHFFPDLYSLVLVRCTMPMP